MQQQNPWLPTAELDQSAAPPLAAVTAETTGPERPQRGVPAPDVVDQLPIRAQAQSAHLWVMGAHGGAGESRVAAFADDWRPAGHAWPEQPFGLPAPVIVVARTHAAGLHRAGLAAQQWAAMQTPNVSLLGLALLPDAPGKLPRPLRDLARHVSGGYPRVWWLPWVEAWRFAPEGDNETVPRAARRLISDLAALTAPSRPTITPEERTTTDEPA